MIPLGPGGDRKLKPILTYTLIGLNVIVFLATMVRMRADDERIELAAQQLAIAEAQIRATAGDPVIAVESFFGMRDETPGDVDFWNAFEAGRIVPIDSPTWKRWDELRKEYDAASRARLIWKWGFRKDAPSVVTMVTSTFLHGGLLHLLGNMVFLWVVGVNMEEEWGRRTFLLLYVLGIVGSTCAVFLESPAAAALPGIGASGAVATVMGAFSVTCFSRQLRLLLFPSPLVIAAPAWVFTGLWFGEQLLELGAHGSNSSGVGVGVHVLGFVVGAGMALALKAAGAEEEIAKPQEKLRREVDKARHLAAADAAVARGDANAALASLREALEADPDDSVLRERKMLGHAALGDREAARHEGLQLLERLWSAGDKATFASAFAKVDEIAQGKLPMGLVHRAAVATEPISPMAAAALYVRVAKEGGDDPVVPQSLRRYALLLDRIGEPEKAAQVRELLARFQARAKQG